MLETEESRVCSEVVSLTNIRCYKFKVLPTKTKQILNKDDTSRHVKVKRRKLLKAHLTQRTTGKCGILEAGEIVFPREEHTKCSANPKWPALKTHKQVTI